jgi:hypothetical protein
MRRVVGLGAIVEVADVAQRDFVAVDLRRGELRHVGLPVGFVAGLECEPPREHDGESRKNRAELAPAPAEENQRAHKGDREDDRGHAAQRRPREIEKQRADGP